jgi:predicted acyl esterase
MPAELLGLDDSQLPAIFKSADSASLRAQNSALRWSRVRSGAAVAAAIGGAFSLVIGTFDVWAFVALIGFVVTFGAELVLAVQPPERRWYLARAGAESVKTLSWRYAVGADPFFTTLPDVQAEVLFRRRVAQVVRQMSEAVSLPEGDGSSPTEAMRTVRRAAIAERRTVYLRDRTRAQRDWYSRKARTNGRAAIAWRSTLIVAELVAITLAALRFAGVWDLDLAGVLAAFIGAGAAWLALKQHTTLQSAYALAAAELQKQDASLVASADDEWSKAVADAEEAISREHTMWLASRSDVNERIG